MKYGDLHLHTTYSDGTDSPDTVVRNCAMLGMNAIAITDHDTTAGYTEAKKEGDKWGIKIIPGVEVSTRHYHILGLNFDISNESFQKFLADTREVQKMISAERVKKLQSIGIPITMEKVEAFFPKSRLGKYNVFCTMITDSECKNFLGGELTNRKPYEVFQQYMGKGGIAGNVSVDEEIYSDRAIKEIHKAGGIAIIAHPFKEVKDIEELDKLREKRIDGLEEQPNNGEKNKPFVEYALKNELIITRGSDFHGASFPRALLNRDNAFRTNNLEKFFEKD